MWIDRHLWAVPSADGHLGCFWLGGIINAAACSTHRTWPRPMLSFIPPGVGLGAVALLGNIPGASANGSGLSLLFISEGLGLGPPSSHPGCSALGPCPSPTPLPLERPGLLYRWTSREEVSGQGVGTDSPLPGPGCLCAGLRWTWHFSWSRALAQEPRAARGAAERWGC